MPDTPSVASPLGGESRVKAHVRVGWIDAIKGIGILLVVLGHVIKGLETSGILRRTPFVAFLDEWIYSFHMPLFFFVAGLFLANRAKRGSRTYLVGLLATLVYPYFVWSILQTLMQSSLASYSNSSGYIRELWRIVYQPIMQFWFIYVLLIIYLIYFLLTKLRFGPWSILSAFIAWHASSSWLPVVDWGPLLLAQYNGVYVALGAAVYGPSFQQFPARLSARSAALLACLGYGMVGLLVYGELQSCPAAALLAAFSGIVATMALAALLERLDWFGFVNLWGRLSLEIYLAHTIASAGIRIVLAHFIGVIDPAIHLIAGTLVGLYFPILLVTLSGRIGFGSLFRLTLPTARPDANRSPNRPDLKQA